MQKQKQKPIAKTKKTQKNKKIVKDNGGRYSYENQVSIFKWNLMKLSEAFDKAGLLDMKDSQAILDEYATIYFKRYIAKLRKKVIYLGILCFFLCFFYFGFVLD